jgi:hypothetical protein
MVFKANKEFVYEKIFPARPFQFERIEITHSLAHGCKLIEYLVTTLLDRK